MKETEVSDSKRRQRRGRVLSVFARAFLPFFAFCAFFLPGQLQRFFGGDTATTGGGDWMNGWIMLELRCSGSRVKICRRCPWRDLVDD